MRNKQRERRPKRPLGPMQLERTVQELPSFQRVVMRFGFVSDLRVDGHSCFQWLKTQPEVVKLMSTTKATHKNDTKQDVRAVEVALTKLSEDMQQLCALRVRWSIHSALNY